MLNYDFILLNEGKKTLKNRGIRKGIEVFVKNPLEPNMPERKARVVNIYPHPSRWLIVQYEDGNMDQVEESQITTMFEINRKGREI
jgi:hypothetical protein